MNVLLMGPPGAGKGTQAERVVARFELLHLATGDLLRKEIREGSELGRKAKAFVESGKLVPDDVIIAMVFRAMKAPGAGRHGFLLDGFPRTLGQAESFERGMKDQGLTLDRVINIRVPDEELIGRCLSRVTCEGCKRIYNLKQNPPTKAGVCDGCGARLVARADDNAAVISERLRVYRTETEPVIAFYRTREILSEVDGLGGIDDVSLSIGRLLAAPGGR